MPLFLSADDSGTIVHDNMYCPFGVSGLRKDNVSIDCRAKENNWNQTFFQDVEHHTRSALFINRRLDLDVSSKRKENNNKKKKKNKKDERPPEITCPLLSFVTS